MDRYTKSEYARRFLSNESLEALEASDAAQIIFVKIPKRDEIKEKHDAGIRAFSEKSKMIEKKKKAIREIDEKGLFQWLFKFSALRKQRKLLESEVEALDGDITKILEETGACYREMTPLNNEIGEFQKNLRMYGLTFDDIKKEYFAIKLVLEREKRKTENQEEVTLPEKPSESVAEEKEEKTDNASQNQPS